MRRITSLLLTALMILSMFAVGAFTTTASAATATSNTTIGSVESGYTPTGTPITSEEEFLAMEENGNYYLANDITLTKTYGLVYNKGDLMLDGSRNPYVEMDFTGTFDGNGKSVTVSAPMFAYLDGATVKNLTVKGEINFRSDNGKNLPVHCGGVAMEGNDLTFENVANNAKIKGYETGKQSRIQNPNGTETVLYESVYVGGLLGSVYGDLSMKDCVNWGDITALCASGLVGSAIKHKDNRENTDETLNALVTNLSFENCSNNGTISDRDCKDLKVEEGNALVLKIHGLCAGVLAWGNATKISFLNCVNSGDVLLEASESEISFGGNVGGISGDLRRSDNLGNNMLVTYENCINDGTVIGARRCGGIGGYSFGSVTAVNCVNNGDVTSRTNYCAGIVGRGGCGSYPNFVCDLIFEHCINNGTVTSHRQYAGGMTGYSQDRIKVNYCLNTGDIRAEGISKTSDNASHRHRINAGGMLARSTQSIEIYYCVNTGNIISNFGAAGIAGRIGSGSINGVSFTGGHNTFFGCLSAGDVIAYNELHLYDVTQDDNGDSYCDDWTYITCSTDTYLADGVTKGKDGICDVAYCKGKIGEDYHKTYYSDGIGAAGIVSFSYGSGNKQSPRVFGCGVTANITSSHGGTACAFIGYANTEYCLIEGNYFTGTLNGPADCIMSPHSVTLRDDYCLEYASVWINSCDSQKYIKENYYLETIKTSGAKRIMNNGAEIDWAGYDCFITRDDIRSGKLCYLVNEAAYDFIGVYPFLQKLGTDLFPTSPYYYLTYTGTADSVSIDTIGDNIEIDYTYWVDEDGNGGYKNVVHIPSETTKEPTQITDPETDTIEDSQPQTSPDTQPDTQPDTGNNSGGNAGGDDKDSGGCGSVVGASIALAMIALAAPAVIVLKKREDEE